MSAINKNVITKESYMSAQNILASIEEAVANVPSWLHTLNDAGVIENEVEKTIQSDENPSNEQPYDDVPSHGMH